MWSYSIIFPVRLEGYGNVVLQKILQIVGHVSAVVLWPLIQWAVRFSAILFLNILTLPCTTTNTISRQFIASFMVLWKVEYFPTFNLLCSCTNVKSCPLVLLRSLILNCLLNVESFHWLIQYNYVLSMQESSRCTWSSTTCSSLAVNSLHWVGLAKSGCGMPWRRTGR